MNILTRAAIAPATWDAFCLAHPGAWFLWTSAYLDYQAARGSRELSFGIMDADRLVAICPLFLEERDGVRSFTMEGHPGPAPLVAPIGIRHELLGESREIIQHHLNELFEGIDRVAFRSSPFGQGLPISTWVTSPPWFDISWHTQVIDLTQSEAAILTQMEIERLAWNEKIGRIAFRGNPLTNQTNVTPHTFQPCGWSSQILDLTQSEAILHAGIRKSYTALINKAERTHRIFVDETGEALAGFRVAHWFKAGRFTRSPETWAMERQWIQDGHALHICAELAGGLDAAAFFIIYKRAACYASAVQLNPNVQHALIWRAMRELKAQGVERLEMGWLDYPGEESRGFFKAGFGGQAVPIVAVERRFER